MSVNFDVDEIPHGIGVKFWADGSIYVGGWYKGKPHTDSKGILTRNNGMCYEGTWMNGTTLFPLFNLPYE